MSTHTPDTARARPDTPAGTPGIPLREVVRRVASRPEEELAALRGRLFDARPISKAGRLRLPAGTGWRVALAGLVVAVLAAWPLAVRHHEPDRGALLGGPAAGPGAAVVSLAGDAEGAAASAVSSAFEALAGNAEPTEAAPALYMLARWPSRAAPFQVREVTVTRVQLAELGVPVDLADPDPFVSVQVVFDAALQPIAVRSLEPARL